MHRMSAARTLLVAALATIVLLGTATQAPARATTKPTIVLVHGAFADASGFGAVTERLQRQGYTVVSPANPLRSLSGDAAYLASTLKAIKGPIVLVGHSYGGAVVTEAGDDVPNVKAIVYLNANALDTGESSFDITQRFTGGLPADALRPQPFPQADGTEGTDVYIDTTRFHALFAADVPARLVARMASAQRPVTLAALQEKVTVPAWKTIPSYFLIGTKDRTIDPAGQRFMAKRAKAQTVEIDASHASYVSHPEEVTKLIIRAARKAG